MEGRGHHKQGERIDLIISVPGGEEGRGRQGRGHHKHGERKDLIISMPGGAGGEGDGGEGASQTR